MLFRVFLSSLLVIVGILSPWLVKDWLDVREGRRAEGMFHRSVLEFRSKAKRTFFAKKANGVEGSVDPDGSEGRASGGEMPPFPLATATKRRLEGALASTSVPWFPGIAGKGPGKLPESALSREVTGKTTPILEGDLEKLGLKSGDPVFLRIFKEENELEVWLQEGEGPFFALFRSYRLEKQGPRSGPKIREGDGRGPEGFYAVGGVGLRPETRHFLGIDMGYPNDFDRYYGRTGSDILIHGGRESVGSYVLPQKDMGEVYTLVEAALRGGQSEVRVHAFPFRMTDRRMEREWKKQPDSIAFWVNLKEGYDFFENVNFPPETAVEAGSYAFRLP